MRTRLKYGSAILLAVALAVVALTWATPRPSKGAGAAPAGVTLPANFINPTPPSDLNPNGGGAPSANLVQASVFAWQEFIALNWPAVAQTGATNTRDFPDTAKPFGDPSATGPLVWETFRSKPEIYPGVNFYNYTPGGKKPPPPVIPMPTTPVFPPGYVNNQAASYGYDAPPRYLYNPVIVGTKDGSIPACDTKQANDPTPWINLDEVTQIGLDSMYVGLPVVNPGQNSDPKRIRYTAKANRTEYVYVVGNDSEGVSNNYFWKSPQLITARDNLRNGLKEDVYPTAPFVSFPAGTFEVKAAWRPLAAKEDRSRFHTATVRYYEPGPPGPSPTYCYWDETWALIALHIIQKTPSAPYFIFATFEQADNIRLPNGEAVEDENGRVVKPPPTGTPSTTPALSYTDSPTVPKVSIVGSAYCDTPANELYYREIATNTGLPSGGYICVNTRDNPIPSDVIAVNTAAHEAIALNSQQQKLGPSPWLYYKLVNVQWVPFDRSQIDTSTPNGPFAPATFYLANSVVETDYTLQMFSGRIASPPNDTLSGAPTEYNFNGTPGFQNTFIVPYTSPPPPAKLKSFNMGGCMGCHGNAQVNGNDFSFILANPPANPDLATQQTEPAVARRFNMLFAK